MRILSCPFRRKLFVNRSAVHTAPSNIIALSTFVLALTYPSKTPIPNVSISWSPQIPKRPAIQTRLPWSRSQLRHCHSREIATIAVLQQWDSYLGYKTFCWSLHKPPRRYAAPWEIQWSPHYAEHLFISQLSLIWVCHQPLRVLDKWVEWAVSSMQCLPTLPRPIFWHRSLSPWRWKSRYSS